MINIKGLDKAAVLAALYNASRPVGMGFMHFDPTPMTVDQARAVLERIQDFDYLKGRAMKVNLEGDELDPHWYDEINGKGAALRAISSSVITGDVNDVTIRAAQASGTLKAAVEVAAHIDEDSGWEEPTEGIRPFRLGLDDVKDQLEPKVREALKRRRPPLE